jgi:hypothetical protein
LINVRSLLIQCISAVVAGSSDTKQIGEKDMRIIIFSCILLSLSAFTAAPRVYAAQADEKQEINRYQIYSDEKTMVLLDTLTGKLWKISTDMSGKMKAEGVTVEGLAYSSSDSDNLQLKMKEINMDGVSDKYKTKCLEELINKFSYRMDAERAKKTTDNYKDK